MHFIGIILIGFVAGIIARFLAPGANNPSGFILTTLLGIAGAFVATFIGQAIGHYQPDEGAGLIGAVIGAVLVLFVWHRLVWRALYPTPVTDAGSRPQRRSARRPALDHDGTRRTGAAGDGEATGLLALTHFQHRAPRRFGGHFHQRHDDLDLGVAIVLSPWAARTASSRVGGSRRTRRRPSFVSHTSLIWHLDSPFSRLFNFEPLLSDIYRTAASLLCNALTVILGVAKKAQAARGLSATGASEIGVTAC